MIASLYISSIPIIVLAFVSYGIFKIFKNPINTLYVIFFTFLFKNFYISFGTVFDTWKLLSLTFLIVYFLKWIVEYSNQKKSYYEILLITFLLYVITITLINQFFFVNFDTNQMIGGFLKNEGRIISQFVFFFLTFNLILISYFLVNKNEHIYNILKLIVLACKILVIFALIQLIFVKVLGQSNPFPINASDGEYHSGYILDKTFRLNSLAGEPKHLGIAMSLGITLLILSILNNLYLTSKPIIWICLFGFVLFYTYSTTGYALTLAGILISFYFKGIFNKKVFFTIIVVLICSILFTLYNFSLDQTFIKQASKNSLEFQDLAVYQYLLNENIFHAFIGTGLGNIHHFAVDYLPINFPLFKDTPFKANSGFLFMLADYGMIGIFLLYISLFFLLKKLLWYTKNTSLIYPEEKVTIYFTIILSLLFLLRYYELLFLFFGIVLKINKTIKERNEI